MHDQATQHACARGYDILTRIQHEMDGYNVRQPKERRGKSVPCVTMITLPE